MSLHWSSYEYLARDRIEELLRLRRQITLVESAAKASRDHRGVFGRLRAAFGRRIAAAQTGKPALGEQAPN